MKYLHEESYYQDLYDRRVVRDCRVIEKKYNSRPVQYIRKIRLTDNLAEWMLAREIAVLSYRRQDTIFQWMLDDKIKEDFIRIVSMPNSPCEKCGKKMKVEIKSFKDGYGILPNRIIFILRCTACNPILLVGLPLDEKFGLNGPISGFFNEGQSEYFHSLIPDRYKLYFRRFSEENQNILGLAKTIESMPSLTEEDFALQVEAMNHQFDEHRG